MGIDKIRILGNDYVGAWAIATDKFFLMGEEVSRGEEDIIKEMLDVPGIRVRIGGSGFVGLYIAANSHGVLMPSEANVHEISALKKHLPEVNVEIIETEYNALRNNILANDKIAIINPIYGKAVEKKISDALNVETIKTGIAGFSTVGANDILTNKGLILNNRASEEEKDRIEKLVGLHSELSTANLGSVSVGLCTITNSNGLVAGRATTGFELSRIAEGLELS